MFEPVTTENKPVSVLNRATPRQPLLPNNAGFTISSVCVSSPGNPNVPNRSSVAPAFKHPEVAQVVQGLLNWENIQPSVNRGSYKHPEVEEVVSRLLL